MKREDPRSSIDERARVIIEKIKRYTQISPVYNSAVEDHCFKYLQSCAKLLQFDFELQMLRTERDESYRQARLAEIDREVEKCIDGETEANWLEAQIAPPMYDDVTVTEKKPRKVGCRSRRSRKERR